MKLLLVFFFLIKDKFYFYQDILSWPSFGNELKTSSTALLSSATVALFTTCTSVTRKPKKLNTNLQAKMVSFHVIAHQISRNIAILNGENTFKQKK